MSADLFEENLVPQIIEFLRSIGIAVAEGDVEDGTFLPGIDVVHGGLVVDAAKLEYPGDLLHEAGHIAVTPASDRPAISGEVETPDSVPELIELEAILWSYAASIHLGLDPRVVFHEHGYHGQSEGLLRNFSLGIFLGVNGLEQARMTLSAADAARLGADPFPTMQKWLKD